MVLTAGPFPLSSVGRLQPFSRFWTTLPGVLTALAGVVSAVVAATSLSSDGQKPPSPGTTVSTSAPAPPPTVPTLIVLNGPAPTLGPSEGYLTNEVDKCANHDLRACGNILRAAVEGCSEGDPAPL